MTKEMVVYQASWVARVTREILAHLDHKAHQALLVHQGERDKKEIQDLSVMLGLPECPGVLEERAKRDILEGME